MQYSRSLAILLLTLLAPPTLGHCLSPTSTQGFKDIATDLVGELAGNICSDNALDLADTVLGTKGVGLATTLGPNVVAALRAARDANGNVKTVIIGGQTYNKYRLWFSKTGFNTWRKKNLSTAGGKWSDLTLGEKRAALTAPTSHELIHACLQDVGENDPFSCKHLIVDIANAHTLCDAASEAETDGEFKILCDAIDELKDKWTNDDEDPPGTQDYKQKAADCYCANKDELQDLVDNPGCNCGLDKMPPIPPGTPPCGDDGMSPDPINENPIPDCEACEEDEEPEEPQEPEDPVGMGG